MRKRSDVASKFDLLSRLVESEKSHFDVDREVDDAARISEQQVRVAGVDRESISLRKRGFQKAAMATAWRV